MFLSENVFMMVEKLIQPLSDTPRYGDKTDAN